MVTVLLAGCIGGGTKTFTLTVNVDPEGAAEVSGVADKYDEKAVAQFTLEAAEGYEFVEWTGEVKPVYNDEDEVWEIVMDGDKTLTAVFKEIEEEPVDPEPVADEEAAAAVDAQITALDKEVGLVQYKKDVAAARTAYEALNAETKALVTKLVLLELHEDQLYELLYGEVTEFVIAEKVMDGIDLTADVLEDITLGSNFTYDGTVYQVTWESDKPEIIGADGTVNRPYGDDVEVTLTATLDFIGALSADQKNVFEIKLNVVGIRFDLAVENGSVTATLNDLTGLDAVTADDFAITFAIADEAVEAEDLKVEYKDGVATWTFTPFERGLEDYKVDIAVTFGEFEEKDSLEFVGLAVIVETVDAINKNGVTVTFEALEEALEGVTVTVIDPEGNEVEVEAQDLEEGATSAEFAFVEALEKDPTTGVWTVSGVTYDFDEFAAVAKVREATNLVELWEALQSDYFTGAVEENIEAYNAADKSKLVTAEDVNKMIADVNASLVDAETVIKPIVDATNELELLRALQNGGFKDVNSKLIDQYKTAMKDTDGTKVTLKTTVEEVQNTIYEVNATAAVDALFDGEVLAEKVDQAQIDAAKALVEKLPEEDQATLMGRVETAQTLLDNAAAYAEAKAAVAALFDTKVEDGKEVIDTTKLAKGVGKAEIDAADELVKALADEVDTESELVRLIATANNLLNTINQRISSVTVSLANKEHTGKTSGKTWLLGYSTKIDFAENAGLEEVTSVVVEYYKGETLLGTLTLRDPSKHTGQFIWGTIDVYGDYVSTSWAHEWNGKLTDIPDTAKAIVKYEDGRVVEKPGNIAVEEKAFYVEALNRTETVEDMMRAIIDLETVLSNGNDFTNLTKQAKLEVAEMVLNARNALETKKFSLTDDSAYNAVTDEDTGAIAVRSAFISGVNEATDIVTMRKELTNEGLFPEFFELSAAEKTEVAELVLNALNELRAELEDQTAKFETIAEIKAAAGL